MNHTEKSAQYNHMVPPSNQPPPPSTHLLHLYSTGGAFNKDLIIVDSDKTTPLYNVTYIFGNSFKGRRSGLEVHHANPPPYTPSPNPSQPPLPPAPIGSATFSGLEGRNPELILHNNPIPFTRPSAAAGILIQYRYTYPSAIGPLTWKPDNSGLGYRSVLVNEREEWIARYEVVTMARRKRARLEIVNWDIAGGALDEIVVTAMTHAHILAERRRNH